MGVKSFNTPYEIDLNTIDDEPVSVVINNEEHVIYDSCVRLAQIPDEFYRVTITGMTEINIKDDISAATEFKVDYKHGVVYFDQSLEGDPVTIATYYGRGIKLVYAERIIARILVDGSYKTLQEMIDEDFVGVGLQFDWNGTELGIKREDEVSYEYVDLRGIVWKGTYSPSTTYQPLDAVFYNGSSYVCILESTGNAPTNITYWETLAQAGDMQASIYDPTSVSGDAFDADNHAYDNSTSGLTATDTQNAIDELQDIKADKTEILLDSLTPFTTDSIIESLPIGTVDGSVDNFEADGLSLVNSVENGDFSGGTTGWTASSSTHSVSSNILSNTASGLASYGQERSNSEINSNIGGLIFYYAKLKPLSSDCSGLQVLMFGETSGADVPKSLSSPPIGVFSELYGVYAVTSNLVGAPNIAFRHVYPDATTANGKVMEIDGNAGVFAINMTELGIEDYTEEQMLDLVRSGYIDGLESIMRPKVETRNADESKSSQLTADVPLRRVPSVADRIYESDGQIWLEKNVEEHVLQSGDIAGLDTTTYSNYDYASTTVDFYNLLPFNSPQRIIDNFDYYGDTFPPDDTSNLYSYAIVTSRYRFIFPKGTYSTLAEAQADLAGTKIHYQLATPELINLTEQGLTSGELMSFENGTVYNSSDTFHSPDVSFDVPSNRAAQIGGLLESANYQSKQIESKASKVQEDVITPTITGGWTATNVYYYKDDFNIVHLSGFLTGGTGSAFTLPTSYVPNTVKAFKQADSTTGNPKVTVGTDGTVTPSGATYLDGISFREGE